MHVSPPLNNESRKQNYDLKLTETLKEFIEKTLFPGFFDCLNQVKRRHKPLISSKYTKET